jgi:hypothetical protein
MQCNKTGRVSLNIFNFFFFSEKPGDNLVSIHSTISYTLGNEYYSSIHLLENKQALNNAAIF